MACAVSARIGTRCLRRGEPPWPRSRSTAASAFPHDQVERLAALARAPSTGLEGDLTVARELDIEAGNGAGPARSAPGVAARPPRAERVRAAFRGAGADVGSARSALPDRNRVDHAHALERACGERDAEDAAVVRSRSDREVAAEHSPQRPEIVSRGPSHRGAGSATSRPCANASKTRLWSSPERPMPVSITSIASNGPRAPSRAAAPDAA